MNKHPRRVQNKQDAPATLSTVKRFVAGACLRYTLLTVGVLVVHALFTALESGTNPYIDPSLLWLLIPFALCLTAAAAIRRADKLSRAVRYTLHPLLSLGSFYLCLYLPYQIDAKPRAATTFVILLCAAAVYAAIVGVMALITHRRRQKTLDKTPYVSRFGDKN